MAEKHASMTITTADWQFYLQKLWTFINTTQSGILQFVTEGGNIAVKSGGSFWDGEADLSSGFGTNGDYIVFEPVDSYPGGDKWQCKFTALDVDVNHQDDCTVEVSWLGGYDTSANDFPGANLTSAALDYPVGYAYFTAVQDSLYFSCSNSDTYSGTSGTQTYTYFRVLLYDGSASEGGRFQGTYVGGYIPTEPDSDTKPVCLFTGIMSGVDNSSAWADLDGTHCVAPANYAHSVVGGNVSCNIPAIGTQAIVGYGLTRSGNWANTPLMVLDATNQTTIGVFGQYTALRYGTLSRTDGAADSNGLYKVGAEIMFRWNTAA